MKKFIAILTTFVILFTYSINVLAYSYSDFYNVVKEVMDQYGIYNTNDRWNVRGLSYGQFIDFDNNGTDELLLIYGDMKSTLMHDAQGKTFYDNRFYNNVAVYGVIDNKVTLLFTSPIASRMCQTDVSYALKILKNGSKTHIIVDNTTLPTTTLPLSTSAPCRERIIIFSMHEGKPSCDYHYAEALDYWETHDLVFTRCIINNTEVPRNHYIDLHKWINTASHWLYLQDTYIGDSSTISYISYEKLAKFIDIIHQKMEDEIKVYVYGKRIDFDVLPRKILNRTMVPVRTIFENLNATIEWDSNNQVITAHKDDTTITMTIGQKELYKNDELITLDVAPTIINSRTFVPTRAIAEAFGCNVSWDAENNAVIIN